MMLVRRLLRSLFLLLVLWGSAPVAHALTFTVSKTADTADGACDADCSLREAITEAAGGDNITFNAALSGQTITLTTGTEIVVDKNLTIDASSLPAEVMVDSGTGHNRIFSVTSGKTVSLHGLTLTGGNGIGASNGGLGGAIHNAGTLMLTQCILSGNSAKDDGGAILNSGTLTLTQCTLSGNSASSGGAIRNEGALTLTQCTISGNSASTGGAISNAHPTLTLTQCTLSGNTARYQGGAIFNSGALFLAQCTLSDNSAGNTSNYAGSLGGAIFGGTLTLTQSTLSGNTASFGGAIYNYYALTLTQCTLSGNAAFADGGAIYSYIASIAGSTSLTHCTLSGNIAISEGGAIYNRDSRTTLTHCTLTGNTALTAIGSGVASYGNLNTETVVRNSIISGNSNNSVDFTDGSANSFTSLGGNFIGSGNATGDFNQSGDVINNTPLLAPLANNGGPTQTMALLPGSPALDAATVIPGLDTDQRGFARNRNGDAVAGALPDIGAYEAQSAPSGGNLNPIMVTTANDELDASATLGSGVSLREAVRNAPDGATITFDASLSGQTITLTTALGGEIVFDKNLTIDASSLPAGVTVDGGTGTNRIFSVSLGKTISLLGLTLTGGNAVGAAQNGNGGAIVNFGTLTLTRCTLSGNAPATGSGGAILNDGGTLSLSQCTLSANTCVNGGAIFQTSGSTLTLTHCTLSGNSASGGFGGGIGNGGTLTLNNSIVAGNTPTNILGNNPSGTNNITSGDPLLAALANNGGPTKTMALLPSSPAINAGDNATASGLTTDQRGNGFPRIVVGTVDIGAFELVPTLSIADKTVNEGDSGTSNATFTVTLAAASTQTVTVQYATANGTATAGSDYTTTSGTMTFTPGQTAKTLNVPIIGNTTIESTENFEVNLRNATGAPLVDAQAIGTIIDDDAVPKISVNNVTVTESNSGPVSANFTISLSSPSGKTVTVSRATAVPSAFPATAGVDYVAVPLAPMAFTPGQTSKTVTVVINGDVLDEFDERFTLNLSSPVNATILDGEGVGTITDNDATPGLVINNATVTEGDTGTANANFTVTLSAMSGKTVTVNYATGVPGAFPATAGVDYVAVPTTTLTFTPGQTSKTVSVTVNGDVLDEENERFAVKLSGQANATIADNEGTGTITDNDALPSLSINDVSLNEGNSGTTAFTFTVTLSAASGRTVTVKAQTLLPGSNPATTGVDYTALPLTTLTFLPGETTKTVTVFVNGDTSVEGTEKFVVKLSAQSNATIADSEGIGSILNDDAAALLAPSPFADDAPSGEEDAPSE